MSQKQDILQSLQSYFTERVEAYGADYRSVDWNSQTRQELCFKQLMQICKDPISGSVAENFSLNDYGCGYGALVKYLIKHNYKVAAYTGFDITPAMSAKAEEMFGQQENCRFTANESDLMAADYTIGSGLLSLKLENSIEQWEAYVLNLLDKLWSLSRKGLAFNSLTKYSDVDRMRPDLYYPDPCFLFDYCKTRFSKNVALLHDYGVYEFTILVRRD